MSGRGRAQDDVRRHNLSALLQVVHARGSSSRAELTAALGLNRSTVAALVGELAATGLVTEAVPDASARVGVGRPSLLVRPVAEAAQVVAAFVDVHRLTVLRVGLGGAVLGRRSEPLPADVSSEAAVDRLVAAAQDLLAAGGTDRLVGVGVAVPGTVRADDGRVAAAPNLGWYDVPLAELVRERALGRLGPDPRVTVANDTDLGAVAERLRGAARGCDDLVYLGGTYGLGGGVLVGGAPLAGSRGYGGEVGHMNVEPSGRPCRCGSRGCWEAETLADAWADALGLDADAPDVIERIRAVLEHGGVTARRTRDRLSRPFARGLASLVAVLDPELVVLGSGLWGALWDDLSGDVMPWFDRLVMPVLREGVTVRRGMLGDDASVLGAAELAFGPLLDDPTAVVAALGSPAC